MQVTSAYFRREVTTQTTMPIGNVIVNATPLQNPYLFENSITQVPVTLSNLSNTHIVVRAYFHLMWQEGYSQGDVALILENPNWTLGEDGYFYYNYILSPFGTSTSEAPFLSAVEIIDESGVRWGTNFMVGVYFEGMQFANNAYKNVWLTAPQEWLNQIEGG
jgi:hypothetical protein